MYAPTRRCEQDNAFTHLGGLGIVVHVACAGAFHDATHHLSTVYVSTIILKLGVWQVGRFVARKMLSTRKLKGWETDAGCERVGGSRWGRQRLTAGLRLQRV